jgi:Zinc-finger of C2H2 type
MRGLWYSALDTEGVAGPRPHPCRAGLLSSRMRTLHQNHTNIYCACRSWICEVCGTALSTQKALQAHGLIHAGPASKVHACALCAKTFRHRNTLTKEWFTVEHKFFGRFLHY